MYKSKIFFNCSFIVQDFLRPVIYIIYKQYEIKKIIQVFNLVITPEEVPIIGTKRRVNFIFSIFLIF